MCACVCCIRGCFVVNAVDGAVVCVAGAVFAIIFGVLFGVTAIVLLLFMLFVLFLVAGGVFVCVALGVRSFVEVALISGIGCSSCCYCSYS